MHREVRWFAFAIVAVLSVMGPRAGAQAPAAAPFMVHQLKPNIFWVEGGGGNSGVIVGDKGVIVIDTKINPDEGKQLLACVAKISSKPIPTVILTHRDIDHIGGLSVFPKGIQVIAHDTA